MTLPTLSFTSWAGIAAAAAMVGSCWRAISGWLQRLLDLVICRVVVKEEAARAVMSRAWKEGKRSPLGLRMFGGITSFVFPKRRVEVVPYEGVTSEPLLFWFGHVPMLIGSGFNNGDRESPNTGGSVGDAYPVTLRYLRGTLDIDAFIQSAVSRFNDLRQTTQAIDKTRARRFNVTRMYGPQRQGMGQGALELSKSPERAYGASTKDVLMQLQRGEMRLITWKPDDLIERSTDAAPFVSHPVPSSLLAEFDEIYTWIKHEQWFRSKGVPWRRGYCLAGVPGTGKDTLVRNLAMRHDLPIYAFDLSTYDNRAFTDDWQKVMQNAPAIALCSDIDTVWKGRENITKSATHDALTFDCFLNTISGVGSSEGVLLFVTTNHLETLDPALGLPTNGGTQSTRPGRIDRVIRMGPMEEPERRALASLILADWPDLIEDTVARGEGEMAAQFQDRCVKLATERFWTDGVKGEIEVPVERLLKEAAQELITEEDEAVTRAVRAMFDDPA